MARVTSSPVKSSSSPRRSGTGEPGIVVEFLEGPEGEQALDDLVRALGRHMARRLFAPANGDAAGPEASGARDE